MKKGMLITVAGMALLAGTADVRAACIPTQDCASLGYKYTAAQCPDGAIACPFDTSKFFCMNPTDDSGSTTPDPAPSVPTSGYCCGYTNYCGYSGGTSNSDDSNCRSSWGRSCYEQCKSYGYPDCTDMHASCRASGGTPVFQNCYNFANPGISSAAFACQ